MKGGAGGDGGCECGGSVSTDGGGSGGGCRGRGDDGDRCDNGSSIFGGGSDNGCDEGDNNNCNGSDKTESQNKYVF